MQYIKLPLIFCLFFLFSPFLLAQTDSFEIMKSCAALNLDLVDYHIHLRGGMTAEKALDRWMKTGIRSGVLENFGRDWPLCNNEKLREFIDHAEKVDFQNGTKELLIGIQVNDRDWFKVIDLKQYRRLDYILADTMIMGTDSKGNPEKLWLLPKEYSVDAELWMQRYMEHNLQILDEPIDILANPTYLPAFVAEKYDILWTEARMRQIIQKAIDHNIALEIQAESEFPKPRFVELALEMGAKLSFGTNNFDDHLKNCSSWKKNIQLFNIQNGNLWKTSF
ncbi:MAG: hypothetical protein Q4C95_03030 [Planctomycetia bacterium]|nr:hypothetical protein [Planctomycetia bacterium]